MSERQLVLILDFGAQYTQLIARRVREQNVFSEIHPCTLPFAEVQAHVVWRRAHEAPRPMTNNTAFSVLSPES